jgi:hypothetical protein
MTTLTLDIDLIATSYKGLAALLNALTVLKDDHTLVIGFPGNHLTYIVAQMKTLAVNTINGVIPKEVLHDFEDLCISNRISYTKATIQAGIRQYLLRDLETNDGKGDVNSIMIDGRWNLTETAPRDEILDIIEHMHPKTQIGPPPPSAPITIPIPAKKLSIVYERQNGFKPEMIDRNIYVSARQLIDKTRSQSCSHYLEYAGKAIMPSRSQSSHL